MFSKHIDDLVYWVWLSLNTPVNNRCIRELFRIVKNPKLIYFMKENELKSYNILDETSLSRLIDKDIYKSKKTVEKCLEKNYNIICYDDEFYPDRLRNIDMFPILLYHRGEKYCFDDLLSISVVGTRKASSYGLSKAREISRNLAYNKALVVSGMALGIDGEAHRGAMDILKPTVAVLGSGLDKPSPLTNMDIYEYMTYNGGIYTEYPPGMLGLPQNFPARNRIISALSLGTFVVEAEKKSGSLITANYALEQGRDVFSIPNSVDSIKSVGTNDLIKNGAILVTCAEDILSEYVGMFKIENKKKYTEWKEESNFKAKDYVESLKDLAPDERKIAESLINGDKTVSEIIEETKIPANYVLSALTMLEIKSAVKSVAGQKYSLNIN